MEQTVSRLLAQVRQYGTIALTVGKSRIVLRRGNPPGKVDHFAIGIDRFDKDSVIRDLKSRGAPPIDGGGDFGLHVMDPNGFPVQLSANDAA